MEYNFDIADGVLFVTIGMQHIASIRTSIPLAKAIDSLRQRIAALEAEKAERERQEPAGQVIGINTVQWKGHGPVLGAKLYYAPPALREPTEEECSRIYAIADRNPITRGPEIGEMPVRAGRAMWQAVREVMTK